MGFTKAPRAAGVGVTSAGVSVGMVLATSVSEHHRTWGLRCSLKVLRGFPALGTWVVGTLARLHFPLPASALLSQVSAYLLVSSTLFSRLKIIPHWVSCVMGLSEMLI